MNEYYDGDWLVIDLIPEFVQVHTGIQFGSPTVKLTRVHTEVAAGAWWDKEWQDYELTELQCFAAACFEAGRKYQSSRKLRKRVDDACKKGWEVHHTTETMQKADEVMSPENIGDEVATL